MKKNSAISTAIRSVTAAEIHNEFYEPNKITAEAQMPRPDRKQNKPAKPATASARKTHAGGPQKKVAARLEKRE